MYGECNKNQHSGKGTDAITNPIQSRCCTWETGLDRFSNWWGHIGGDGKVRLAWFLAKTLQLNRTYQVREKTRNVSSQSRGCTTFSWKQELERNRVAGRRKVVAMVQVVLLSLLFVEIINPHCHPLQHYAEQTGNINCFSFISECFSSGCVSSFS